MNSVKPVLRYPGSKYRKRNLFIEILDIKEDDVFLDMFGGSGIVGVNVQYITGAKTTINDFDEVLPVRDNFAIRNQISFQGLGKNFTKAAQKQFTTKLKNGYWSKVDIYNGIVDKCELIHKDFNELNLGKFTKIYVDPPYFNIKGLYKGSVIDHKKLRDKLVKIMDKNVKILISYNNTPEIIELYQGWVIKEIDFQYQTGALNKTGKKKKTTELLITNF